METLHAESSGGGYALYQNSKYQYFEEIGPVVLMFSTCEDMFISNQRYHTTLRQPQTL